MNRKNGINAATEFSVEIETAPVADLSVGLGALVDHISNEIARHPASVEVQTAASADDRTVSIRTTVRAESAADALSTVLTVAESVWRSQRCGAFQSVRVAAAPPERPERTVAIAPAAAWPTQFSPPAPPSSGEMDAFATAKLLGAAHALARDIQAAGDADLGRSIERWLRPGLSTLEALHGLRNELIGMRATHMPFIHNVDQRFDALIAAMNRSIAALRHAQ